MSVVKKCFRLIQLKQHFDKKGYPEREVIAYLKSWNPKLKQDEYGNLYLINPGTPLLNAHMDTVQSEECVKNLSGLRLKNGMIGCLKPAVIGGDDKCGIAIAMELYEKLGDKVSLLFTRQEEVGMVGAGAFCTSHSNLLAECKYCLTLDRRGGGDIIGYKNCYCSKEFENEIYRLTKEFGYKPEKGFASDANKISKFLNCVNLSVGYYNPHMKTEFIKCDELQNACEAVQYIVEHLTDDYPIYQAPVYSKENNGVKQPSLYDGIGGPADEEEDDGYYARLKARWDRYKTDKTLDDETLHKYFIYSNGQLIVKKNIFLTDLLDDSNWAELPEGNYSICEYDEII